MTLRIGSLATGYGGLDAAVAAMFGADLAWVADNDPAAPVKPGRNGMRLSEEFVEWMQGLPPGWVTGVPGLSRNAKLKALGNGVVPRSVLAALVRVSGLWLMRLSMGG